MAEVIAYLRNKPSIRPRESAGTAQILFFTGVRYSRMNEAAPLRTNNNRPSSDDNVGGKRRRKRG